jgi:ATP-dependent helicase/nuclease subunit A
MNAGADPRRIAQDNQRLAADPLVSAFVSASAGSGKTKLLTDRLLRLMLAGAEPGRIQCLTYTRAGAAEMRLRLQKRLGAWVTAGDDVLDAALADLALAPDAALRGAARALFARVLDLPGGMRIDTIHAFCQSLLRRFPLEAGLPPRFDLVEDAAARPLCEASQEAAMLAAEPAVLDVIAPQIDLAMLDKTLGKLRDSRGLLGPWLAAGIDALCAAQRRVLGLGAEEDEEFVLRAAINDLDLPHLRSVLAQVGAHATETIRAKLVRPLAFLAGTKPHDPRGWHEWASYFLKAGELPCAEKNLLSADARRAHPELAALLLDEQRRVCATIEKLRSVRVAELSAAMMALALPAVAGYERAKQQAGKLDYGDLISYARELLRDPGAGWVLYKLDGGLDHLLLDEVQDTAPDQWRIADALTAEFFAGAGARESALPRSIFAVGDHKQSIFSFQGAAPEAFAYWREHMQGRAEAAGQAWRNVPLEVSFRSTGPVLALVDAVFARAECAMGVGEERLRHIADRAGDAGSVTLWPVAPYVKPDAREPGERSGAEKVAAALAGWIAGEIERGALLESAARPVHAGDFLVLVRNRGAFGHALLRELKARQVAVAGLDRMMLVDQPAVADLLVLCEALLLPQDDLAVASVLTSPLGGLDDAGLMALALGRRGSLWEALRARADERPAWRAAWDFLAGLFARVDYVTPHALLAEALGPLGGRARLFERLGAQAGEAIDELLTSALAYQARQVPSLQGFVQWQRQSGAEVKREAEGAGRAVRIMTVHSAKGLEAPIVILPAMVGLGGKPVGLAWARDAVSGDDVPLWGPRQATRDAVMQRQMGAVTDAEREEHYRLLYVALTRARDRLLICGWAGGHAVKDAWYDAVRGGLESLPDVERSAFPHWEGEMLVHASAQTRAIAAEPARAAVAAANLPAWAGDARGGWVALPPPREGVLPASLAPSRPAGAELGPVPPSASPLALRDAAGRRFRRGQVLHGLLQHLPNVAPAARAAAALRYLGRPGLGLAPHESETLVGEVMGLLDDPALAPLFGPGSQAEVPLTGLIATPQGPAVVGGLVDRLAVLADVVMIADYKTNRDPPAVGETPVLYLRQMASYRAVLAGVFAGRAIRCALIWTRVGRVDWLSDASLAAQGLGPAILEAPPDP